MELGLPWRFRTGALELWNQEPKLKSVAKAVYHFGKKMHRLYPYTDYRVTTSDFYALEVQGVPKTWEFAMELGRPWRFGTWNLKSMAKAVYHRGKKLILMHYLHPHTESYCARLLRDTLLSQIFDISSSFPPPQ